MVGEGPGVQLDPCVVVGTENEGVDDDAVRNRWPREVVGQRAAHEPQRPHPLEAGGRGEFLGGR